MKIEPRHLRFFSMWPHVWWRRLRFLPRGNSLQIQETGLVVQGHLQKLGMPLLDLFFRALVSEWSTVTVPYSRILFLRPRRFIVARVLLTLLACLPLLLYFGPWLVTAAVNPGRVPLDGVTAYVALLLALLALVLGAYVDGWLLVARHYLLFEEPGGSLALLAFRIKSARLRRRFVELVDNNRRTTQAFLPPRPAPPAPPEVT